MRTVEEILEELTIINTHIECNFQTGILRECLSYNMTENEYNNLLAYIRDYYSSPDTNSITEIFGIKIHVCSINTRRKRIINNI